MKIIKIAGVVLVLLLAIACVGLYLKYDQEQQRSNELEAELSDLQRRDKQQANGGNCLRTEEDFR